MGTALSRVALEATERPNFDLDCLSTAWSDNCLIKQLPDKTTFPNPCWFHWLFHPYSLQLTMMCANTALTLCTTCQWSNQDSWETRSRCYLEVVMSHPPLQTFRFGLELFLKLALDSKPLLLRPTYLSSLSKPLFTLQLNTDTTRDHHRTGGTSRWSGVLKLW